MRLFNTLTQSIEAFQPRGKEVTIYVCGITPYDTTHLGHAFTYTNADIIIRYLEMRDLRVRYVQNITDIDDDILRKARETGEDWQALGKRWTAHFIHDMQALNVRPPDEYPRATDVINEIILSVGRLITAGVAYEAGGSVYYDVSADPDFGKLSHLDPAEWLPIANQRGNRPDDPRKRHPLDFVLWQAQAPGEPAWPSPWGPGRPGWHIECSTMSTKYLGEVVDIHGGGADLCFPHHECEIAQMEPVRGGKPLVRFWMHSAMVGHAGEKMSKSLGNLIMVRDLLQTYHPDALRLYLANHHYREAWSYDEAGLKQAQALAEKLQRAANATGGKGVPLAGEAAWAAFSARMDQDLDTAGAIQVMADLADEINTGSLGHREVSSAQQALRAFGTVFGLRLENNAPEERVQNGWARYLERA